MSNILNNIETTTSTVVSDIDAIVKKETPIVIQKTKEASSAWQNWSQKHPNAAHAIVFGILGFILGTLVHF